MKKNLYAITLIIGIFLLTTASGYAKDYMCEDKESGYITYGFNPVNTPIKVCEGVKPFNTCINNCKEAYDKNYKLYQQGQCYLMESKSAQLNECVCTVSYYKDKNGKYQFAGTQYNSKQCPGKLSDQCVMRLKQYLKKQYPNIQ